MPTAANDPEALRRRIVRLFRNFEEELRSGDLRDKVLALIPVFHALRNLGKSLIPRTDATSARERILYYFLRYPGIIIKGDELLVVSGIQEYARRVRELRVQIGWAIASGVTIRQMQRDEPEEVSESLRNMKPDDYVLLHSDQDRDAAHRWNIANNIRKEQISVQAKILKFLLGNVGKPVTGEELRYVANGRTEWARRVRELRTEQGWPVATKVTGSPDLPVGEYIRLANRQTFEHDRRIPDGLRREVLRRDDHKCTDCGWSYTEWLQIRAIWRCIIFSIMQEAGKTQLEICELFATCATITSIG